MFKFLKIHSCGNDFLIFFNKINDFLLSKIINKKSGISCDQLFIIEKICFKKKNIKIKILNNDLSIANNCGNGIRSLSWFFLKKKKNNEFIKFPLKNNFVYSWKSFINKIYTCFKNPTFFKKIIIRINFYFIKSGFVELNNLHLVIIIKNIKTNYISFFFLKLNLFFNKIINIEFIQIIKKCEFYIRIFEKGVGETFSCGTGIISACFYLKKIFFLNIFFKIYSLGGINLVFFFYKFIILFNNVNFCCFGYI